MMDSLVLLWVSLLIICVGHLFLSFSQWHPDGVLGSLTYGAIGVTAGVPVLGVVFQVEEYIAAFSNVQPELRGFLFCFFSAYAAEVLRKAYVTQRDRRRSGRRQNRRGALDPRMEAKADAVRY